jgi:hypothetical protein
VSIEGFNINHLRGEVFWLNSTNPGLNPEKGFDGRPKRVTIEHGRSFPFSLEKSKLGTTSGTTGRALGGASIEGFIVAESGDGKPVGDAESGSTANRTAATIHSTDLTTPRKMVHSVTARMTTADSS